MRISDWSSDVCSSDLLAAIRAQHPAVGVVVVSANDDPQVIRRALDHGAAGFIPKSADLDSLRDAVLSVLGGQPWLPDALRNAVAMTRSQQPDTDLAEIGRASCRERVCPYVSISVVAVALKKKKI